MSNFTKKLGKYNKKPKKEDNKETKNYIVKLGKLSKKFSKERIIFFKSLYLEGLNNINNSQIIKCFSQNIKECKKTIGQNDIQVPNIRFQKKLEVYKIPNTYKKKKKRN